MAVDLNIFLFSYTVSIWFFVAFLILFGMLFILCINEGMSRLAIYHSPKSRNNCNGEPFYRKFFEVLMIYIFLSLFFFVAILVTMRFSGITNLDGSIIVSEIGTLFLMIMIRLLLNPTSEHLVKKIYPNESTAIAIKIFKERIISLFFSYLCITWIIFSLYLLVKISEGVTFQSSVGYFIPTDFPDAIFFIIITYGVSLFVLTLVTEIYLRLLLPFEQTPWVNKRE